MIKSIFFISCSLLFFHATIFAVLPPLFEDIAEIKAILDDRKLGEMLGSGETIHLIKKIEKGYLILTNKHKLIVRVIYKPTNRPGPAQFEIQFQTPFVIEPESYSRD